MKTSTSIEPQVVSQRPLFDSMLKFHRDRVEQIVNGELRLHENSEDGCLLLHFLPEEAFSSYRLIDATSLKELGSLIPPLGGRGAYGKFNVDGFVNHDDYDSVDRYSVLYRDGRVEALMPSIRYSLNQGNQAEGPYAIRDFSIDEGVLKTTEAYLSVTEKLEISTPVWLFSCIIGCRDVHICTDPMFRDLSRHRLDRSPCFLPPLRLERSEEKKGKIVRRWSDLFWQAFGMDRSLNFDENGDLRARRR
jgi:hypothetical protein